MKTINLTQNTDDWKSWRMQGIGGSDAAAIMAESKYLTPHDLFIEKTGGDNGKKVNEFITSLGHRFEPMALGHVNIMEDADYEPRLVEMEEYPWLKASLDGFDETIMKPMEIKYVGAEKFGYAQEKIVQDLSHWIQMQHQMMICGADSCLYCCYVLDKSRKYMDDITYFDVAYDKEYVLQELWKREFAFWTKVVKGKWIEPQSQELSVKDLKIKRPNWAECFVPVGFDYNRIQNLSLREYRECRSALLRKLGGWFTDNVEPINKMLDAAVEVKCVKGLWGPNKEEMWVAEEPHVTSHQRTHTALLINIQTIKQKTREEKLEGCLRGLIEIGKRDLSNLKYDGYFDSAKELLKEK